MAPFTRFALPRLAACIALLGGLALSSCTDGGDLQGPEGRSGLLRVAPQLSFMGVGFSDATDEGLGAAWRERDEWRARVVAQPDERMAADTVIDVAAANEIDTLAVELETRPSDRSYDFHFTALDASGSPLFSTTIEGVTLTDGEEFEVEGELEYVGRGAEATSVLVQPDTLRLLPGLTGGLEATVLGADEEPIEDVPLGWSSDDPAVAEVDDSGVVRGVSPGATRIAAGTPSEVEGAAIVVVTQLEVEPAAAEVPLGGAQEFTATNAPEGRAVAWSVNGTDGGDEAFGTVSDEGVYQAPAAFPEPSTFEVCARLAEAAEATDCAEVTLVVPPLEVLPQEAERLPEGTQQFSVENAPDGAAIVWSVNGTDGGDEVFGTITAEGFYTAPGEVPDPASFPICARIEGAPQSEGCATMTIQPIPTAGEDLVVINDMNIFDEGAMTAGVGDPNNHVLVRNLIGFTGDRARSDETVILWDRGRNSPCANSGPCLDPNMATTRSIIENAGYTIRSIESEQGTLTEIEPDVKMIWLWNPTVEFTVDEVNTLKRFAAEGGRILFIGEHSGFFGSAGIATENQLLADMGAEMVNVGRAEECAYQDLPANTLREHQITEGMEAVRLACASVIEPGPNDFALITDRTETLVLAGVAKIDVVPITEHAPTAAPVAPVPAAAESASGVDAPMDPR